MIYIIGIFFISRKSMSYIIEISFRRYLLFAYLHSKIKKKKAESRFERFLNVENSNYHFTNNLHFPIESQTWQRHIVLCI